KAGGEFFTLGHVGGCGGFFRGLSEESGLRRSRGGATFCQSAGKEPAAWRVQTAQSAAGGDCSTPVEAFHRRASAIAGLSPDCREIGAGHHAAATPCLARAWLRRSRFVRTV